jgi:GNAT superfamily N-acetyltransferase
VITFAVEPLDNFVREALPLFERHYGEVALNRDRIKLKIDLKQYEAQENAGALCIVVARNAGKIVGYWLGFIRPHFHYADSLTAYTDIYFVDKEHRKQGAGAQLFEYVEKVLAARGVERIFTATKLHLDHSALFQAAGYAETERVFTKLLGA